MRLTLYTEADKKFAQVEARPGQSFAQAIWLSSLVKPRALCAGLGRCGRCRVCFLNDKAPAPVPDDELFFSSEELAQGWRLACQHVVPDEDGLCEIMLPKMDLERPATHIPHILDQSKPENFFLAIDLGTTSIEWRCISASCTRLIQSSLLNPQAAAGSDVISRLKFSATNFNRDLLSDLVLAEISKITAKLTSQGLEVQRLSIAANSVMTHILLKCDVHGLSAAPYKLTCRGGEIISLPLQQGSLPCVIPPLPAPFIGGDISAGLCALIMDKLERPFLLADLGTNAELALLLPKDRLYLASAPLGPAMEGIGPMCGQPAGSGVATAFTLGSDGIIPHYFDSHTDSYISATGYLSLISLLLNLGLMDREGHFVHKSASMPLLRNIQNSYYKFHGQDALRITDKLFICSTDVELLLKVKASFGLALKKLLEAAQVKADEIRNFVLSGAISQHAELSDLLNLGLIPKAFGERVIQAGNTSLEGACILASDPSHLDKLRRLCASAYTIDLTNDPDFLNSYMAEMTWQ